MDPTHLGCRPREACVGDESRDETPQEKRVRLTDGVVKAVVRPSALVDERTTVEDKCKENGADQTPIPTRRIVKAVRPVLPLGTSPPHSPSPSSESAAPVKNEPATTSPPTPLPIDQQAQVPCATPRATAPSPAAPRMLDLRSVKVGIKRSAPTPGSGPIVNASDSGGAAETPAATTSAPAATTSAAPGAAPHAPPALKICNLRGIRLSKQPLFAAEAKPVVEISAASATATVAGDGQKSPEPVARKGGGPGVAAVGSGVADGSSGAGEGSRPLVDLEATERFIMFQVNRNNRLNRLEMRRLAKRRMMRLSKVHNIGFVFTGKDRVPWPIGPGFDEPPEKFSSPPGGALASSCNGSSSGANHPDPGDGDSLPLGVVMAFTLKELRAAKQARQEELEGGSGVAGSVGDAAATGTKTTSAGPPLTTAGLRMTQAKDSGGGTLSSSPGPAGTEIAAVAVPPDVKPLAVGTELTLAGLRASRGGRQGTGVTGGGAGDVESSSTKGLGTTSVREGAKDGSGVPPEVVADSPVAASSGEEMWETRASTNPEGEAGDGACATAATFPSLSPTSASDALNSGASLRGEECKGGGFGPSKPAEGQTLEVVVEKKAKLVGGKQGTTSVGSSALGTLPVSRRGQAGTKAAKKELVSVRPLVRKSTGGLRQEATSRARGGENMLKRALAGIRGPIRKTFTPAV